MARGRGRGRARNSTSKGTEAGKGHIWETASGWAECGLCDVSAAGCGGLECHARSVDCNQQVVTGLLCSTEAFGLQMEGQARIRRDIHLDLVAFAWIRSRWSWGQWECLCGRKYAVSSQYVALQMAS